MKNFFLFLLVLFFVTAAISTVFCAENKTPAREQGNTKKESLKPGTSIIPSENRPQKQQIVWMKLSEGIKIARERKLPVYIEFYATWCPPCKMMAQTTFQDAAVIKLLGSNFVSVKVDVDQEHELAAKFGAKAIPHHIVMSPAGEVRKTLRGALPPDIFIMALKDTLK